MLKLSLFIFIPLCIVLKLSSISTTTTHSHAKHPVNYTTPKKIKWSTSSNSIDGIVVMRDPLDGDKSSDVTLDVSSTYESVPAVEVIPSSTDRKGWRKFHRKCTPCPDDMIKKWRDPSIAWICGGYQRARRTFKSLCMMYYRNCQDGTMFQKLHDFPCRVDDEEAAIMKDPKRRGEHFFYDYKVKLDSEDTGQSSESSVAKDSSSDMDGRRRNTNGTKVKIRKAKNGNYTKGNDTKIYITNETLVNGTDTKVGSSLNVLNNTNNSTDIKVSTDGISLQQNRSKENILVISRRTTNATSLKKNSKKFGRKKSKKNKNDKKDKKDKKAKRTKRRKGHRKTRRISKYIKKQNATQNIEKYIKANLNSTANNVAIGVGLTLPKTIEKSEDKVINRNKIT